jgi:hypothetical protein
MYLITDAAMKKMAESMVGKPVTDLKGESVGTVFAYEIKNSHLYFHMNLNKEFATMALRNSIKISADSPYFKIVDKMATYINNRCHCAECQDECA